MAVLVNLYRLVCVLDFIDTSAFGTFWIYFAFQVKDGGLAGEEKDEEGAEEKENIIGTSESLHSF